MDCSLDRAGAALRRDNRVGRRTVEAKRQGVPIVVSAPSGGGKTTICRQVMERLSGVEFSVSHTTRAPRPGERDGVDYHFVTDRQFVELVDQDAFIEWAHVHGRRYGTSHQEAERRLDLGIDVLFDIDVQGGRQILQRLPDAVLVFLVPPTLEILERRLRSRQSDSDDEIARRLKIAADEIRQATFYTHWIVNDDLTQAVHDLEAIICAERLRRVDKQALMRRVMGL